MTDTIVPLSSAFDTTDQADWEAAVDKALKGKPLETLFKRGVGEISIRPLYRETDWPASTDPLGAPGLAPFLRGPAAVRDRFLPWDIRQVFSHPDPAQTNTEILRDLERGVSSIELKLDRTGTQGVAIASAKDFSTALNGVRADIATVALDHGEGSGSQAAALLGVWGQTQDDPKAQKFAFNMDPLGGLARFGLIEGGLDRAFADTAALTRALSANFPAAKTLRIDARMVHEAGGLAGEELGFLIASAVDTLRRLDAAGTPLDAAVSQMVFAMATSANYGVDVAKIKAARRLWARCLDALKLAPTPMVIQSVTASRMLTRYDSWTNILRNTAGCFAAGVGGADIVTVQAFNAALGVPEELGRRISRNTQIIAQEESNLGRVADPAGGAWFVETVADELAKAGWTIFQAIEAEGGLGESLMGDKFQAVVAKTRAKRIAAVAKRKEPVTGVSEFPLLDEVAAPVADVAWTATDSPLSDEGMRAFLPDVPGASGDDAEAEPFWPIRIAEPFERLRDHAEAQREKTGSRPVIFLATLGPLAEHTARADFARNLFATGGIEALSAPVPPKNPGELAAAFTASGCRLAVLCGSDKRYEAEAAEAAAALKAAGVQRLYLAGRHAADGIDSHIYMGVDLIDTLELAHAELGILA